MTGSTPSAATATADITSNSDDGSKLGILIVNPMGRDGWGGVERWLLDVCRGLAERGHRIAAAGRPSSAWLSRSEEAGFQTLSIPLRADFQLRQARTLSRFMTEFGADVVLTKLHRGIRSAGFAAKLAGAPPVIAFMGLVETRPGLRYRLTYDLFLDGVVTLSDRMRDAIVERGGLAPDSVRAIPYGVVIDRYRTVDGAGATMRRQLGVPENAPLAVAVGRLNEQKRFDLLLEAFRDVHAQLPEARLVIAGTGSLERSLIAKRDELQLAGVAQLIGFRRDVPSLLAAADTLVMSSDDEGLPMVILETMAAARPVVATTVGSIDDQVVPGETGLLVPRRDVPALTNALVTMLGDLDRAREMGEAARERVSRLFPLDLCVRRTEAYLREITRERRAASPPGN